MAEEKNTKEIKEQKAELSQEEKTILEVSDKITKLLKENNCALKATTLLDDNSIRHVINIVYVKPKSDIVTPKN